MEKYAILTLIPAALLLGGMAAYLGVRANPQDVLSWSGKPARWLATVMRLLGPQKGRTFYIACCWLVVVLMLSAMVIGLLLYTGSLG